MKTLFRRFGLLCAIAGVACFGYTTPASAQDRGGSMDRLERLEKRVNEMAEHQEQFMRRFGAQMEKRDERQIQRPGPAGIARAERMRAQLPPVPPPAGPGAPQNPQAAKAAKGLHDLFGLIFMVCVIANILLAIWIYTDIRKRNEGSGIFVALALVAGVPAALIYALTRIGDKKA